jgi:hypothetical protein
MSNDVRFIFIFFGFFIIFCAVIHDKNIANLNWDCKILGVVLSSLFMSGLIMNTI